jgi:hypothetical protein
VDPEAVREQLPQLREHLEKLGDRLPPRWRSSSRRSSGGWLREARPRAGRAVLRTTDR